MLLVTGSAYSFITPSTANSRRYHQAPTSAVRLLSSLYDDQQQAMARRAEVERTLLEAHNSELVVVAPPPPKPVAAKKKTKTKKGTGFGGAAAAKPTAKAATAPSASESTAAGWARTLAAEGVVLIPSALSPGVAERLRECVMLEIDAARESVRFVIESSDRIVRRHSMRTWRTSGVAAT